MFINISYVDFVCLPISLTLTSTSGASQHVSGMPSNGLATVCSNLIAQNATDGAGWNQLVVQSNGQNLRALSPVQGIVFNPSLFTGYYQGYVNAVWAQYANKALQIDTQAQWGTVSANVVNNLLTFPNVGTFAQPAAKDIFSCSTGPFSSYPSEAVAEMGNIGARLAAAFNRITLLIDSVQPDGETVGSYYGGSNGSTVVTNHYARIVHEANLDGRGYAFPYDDVGPDGGADQSGSISERSPAGLVVAVGGGNATA